MVQSERLMSIFMRGDELMTEMKYLLCRLLKQKQWFDSPEFQERFHCEVPLGSFCSSEKTEFRLWAPTAEKVVLHLYEEGHRGKARETAELLPGEKGPACALPI